MGPLRVVTSWLGSAVQKYPYLLTYLIRWRKSEYNFLLSGTTGNKLHFTDAIVSVYRYGIFSHAVWCDLLGHFIQRVAVAGATDGGAGG